MDKKSRELVMAKLYLKNKDYKLAEKSFNEYLSISPNDVTALKLLAQVYEQTKRFDKAFEMYERSYLAEPERTGVLLDICRILLMNELWLENVDYRKWLNLAVKHFPSNPIVVNFKAFLSTTPSDEVLPRETYKTSNEDPLSKILDKLSNMEKRLENIEHKIGRLSISESTGVTPNKPEVGFTSIKLPTSSSSKVETKPTYTLSATPISTTPKLDFSLNETKNDSPFQPKPIQEVTPSTGPKVMGNNFSFSFSMPKLETNRFEVKPPAKEEADDENEGEGEGDVSNNEELPIENTCDMEPIVIKTGEEDEDILFEHRCKLYRFKDKEYKERGLGAIKVLKHKETGKGRLIMRRDAVGLVCLNCWDCSNIERVRDTQIKWAGMDTSDGAAEATLFVVRFKTPELADTFMDHMNALFKESDSSDAKTPSSSPEKPNVKPINTTPETTNSIFGRPTNTTPAATNPIFGRPTNTTTAVTNPIFGKPTNTTPAATKSIFGQPNLGLTPTSVEPTNDPPAKPLFQNLGAFSMTPEKAATPVFKGFNLSSSQPDTTAPVAQQTSLFSSLMSSPSQQSEPTTTNLFAESMKRLNVPSTGPLTFGNNFSFNFSLPNSAPEATISEVKATNEEEADGDGEGDVSNNEELPIENTCDMEPIVIKTGEEDEDILFEHRCKLYRFKDKEYKERGLGAIKVLKHKETGKGRLIMRRDAVGLVCLNCWDCSNIERVRDTQIKWAGVDASDGAAEPTLFVVRFKTPDLADTFINHMNALFNESVSSNSAQANNAPEKPDVELVDPQLDQNLVDKARKFQLPDLFYHKLKNQEPCSGCDGCETDE